MKILQWNINGYNTHKERLQMLINNTNPDIICLQETNLKETYAANIKNYSPLFTNRTHSRHASGGVATYIKNNISCKEISLNTDLEVVATSVLTLSMEICICNIYIPNSYDLSISELSSLINKLPKPFILLGDFNSHSTPWGSNKNDPRGEIIKSLLDDPDLFLLNSTSPTHVNIANGTLSSIDLSICSTRIAHHFDWDVDSNPHDSDHFPITLSGTSRSFSLADTCMEFKKSKLEPFPITYGSTCK